MSKIIIRNEESEKGKVFWKAVDSAAEKAPELVKVRIMSTSTTEQKRNKYKNVKFTINVNC